MHLTIWQVLFLLAWALGLMLLWMWVLVSGLSNRGWSPMTLVAATVVIAPGAIVILAWNGLELRGAAVLTLVLVPGTLFVGWAGFRLRWWLWRYRPGTWTGGSASIGAKPAQPDRHAQPVASAGAQESASAGWGQAIAYGLFGLGAPALFTGLFFVRLVFLPGRTSGPMLPFKTNDPAFITGVALSVVGGVLIAAGRFLLRTPRRSSLFGSGWRSNPR